MDANFFVDHALEIHLLAGLLSVVGGFALIGIFKAITAVWAGLADKTPAEKRNIHGVNLSRIIALGAH